MPCFTLLAFLHDFAKLGAGFQCTIPLTAVRSQRAAVDSWLHCRITAVRRRSGRIFRHRISCAVVRPDHPRVGGEHWVGFILRPCSTGSSPRGRGTRCLGEPGNSWCRIIPAWRGTRVDEHSVGGFVRIIPAWAGNTCCGRRSCSEISDHPRVGGEHSRKSWISGRIADHPRVGGEHLRAAKSSASVIGSSPRGRGTLVAGGVRVLR